MICSKMYMVVQQSLKPTDLQLPACFVYQSLSKELESNVQKQNTVCPRYNAPRYNADSGITRSTVAPENKPARGRFFFFFFFS